MFGVSSSGHLVSFRRLTRTTRSLQPKRNSTRNRNRKLMNAPPLLQSNKPLPSFAGDKLPPTPPSADPSFSSSPPQPPPKFLPDPDTQLPSNGLRPPPIDVSLSNELLGQGPPFYLLSLLRLSHALCLGFV